MTQDAGPSQPGSPGYPSPDRTPSNQPPGYQTPGYSAPTGPVPGSPAPYGSNPYSAGPVWPGIPGSWGQPAPSGRSTNSVNAISLVQLVAGVAILVSLLLPWLDVAFSYFDTGGASTFVSLATDSKGLGQLWLDLILLGVAFAVIASVMSLSMRDVTRATSAVALIGFGLVVVGAGYYLAEGNAWDYSILSPGPGVYLCLLAAVIGGLAAVAHLANPRLGASSAVSTGYWGGGSYGSVPPNWSEWPGVTYPGPVYPGAPARIWPPQPLAPTYPAPTSSMPPYVPPAPVASPGWAAQLVVLEAGQSRMMSVRPGEKLLVGSDADAQVRIADSAVQPRHATIERRSNVWVVRDLQTASPTRLIDATGSINLLLGETTVEAGQLLIGSVLLTLSRGQP